jgi:hypothetical protein
LIFDSRDYVDGTVPYASLSFAKVWQAQLEKEEKQNQTNIECIEIKV